MENSNTFDLSSAVQQWRKNLALAPALDQQNLDELESHLRDSIAQLELSGLSVQEAFLIGVNRIGSNHSVETEFGKVNRKAVWLDRGLWMLIGIQVWNLTSNLSQSIARNAFAFGWKDASYSNVSNNAFLPTGLCALLQITGVVGSVWLSWWLIGKWGGRIGKWLGPHIKGRFGFAVCLFSLIALSALVYASNYFSQVAFIRSSKPEITGKIMMYVAYSSWVVWLFQTVFMLATTLILFRRKLRVSQA
jgi:hypothetical protein